MTALALAKKVLPPRVREVLRSAAESGSAAADRILELVGRKGLRLWRSVSLRQLPGLEIAMLCIRKPVYVDMAISSINSLHYRNPGFCVFLHLDRACFESLERKKKRLDYPGRLQPILVDDESSVPWQFTKLDVVLAMSSRGVPFVDADSRWHADPQPLIPQDRAMFLVEVNRFEDVEWERALVVDALCHQEWASFRHFNTGFVSIPAHLCSTDFAAECRALARRIYELPFEGRFSEEQNRLRKHVCEELALSLAAQTSIGEKMITVLKSVDGPGDRNRLQSFYYGALNRVD
jgi:hypothetical protein